MLQSVVARKTADDATANGVGKTARRSSTITAREAKTLPAGVRRYSAELGLVNAQTGPQWFPIPPLADDSLAGFYATGERSSRRRRDRRSQCFITAMPRFNIRERYYTTTVVV